MPKISICKLGLLLISVILFGCRQKSTNQPTSVDTKIEETGTVPDNALETSNSPPSLTRNLSELEKIEALIAALAELKDATFIRNGEPHDVTEAIAHMRRKWEWKKDEIATADDFIRIAASRSSTTGTPYRIRFAESREIDAADWFRARLAEIEAGGSVGSGDQ